MDPRADGTFVRFLTGKGRDDGTEIHTVLVLSNALSHAEENLVVTVRLKDAPEDRFV